MTCNWIQGDENLNILNREGELLNS